MSGEEILLRKAASGDSAAFASLVRRHQSPLRGFLLRLTRGNHALADDLAQEAFIEAYRKLAQHDGRGSFAGWLYAIAWSRFRMAVRKRRPEALGEDDIPDTAAAAAGGSEARLDLEKSWQSSPRWNGQALHCVLPLACRMKKRQKLWNSPWALSNRTWRGAGKN